jgi:hypothetical protein
LLRGAICSSKQQMEIKIFLNCNFTLFFFSLAALLLLLLLCFYARIFILHFFESERIEWYFIWQEICGKLTTNTLKLIMKFLPMLEIYIEKEVQGEGKKEEEKNRSE